jgi:hypothetical protein
MKNDKITKRQKEQKEAIIQNLEKIPIIQVICEKLGISRATFYRWRESDPDFDKRVKEALNKGISLINDLAESKLLANIQDQNTTSIIFWLKNHHSAYRERLEVSTSHNEEEENLTSTQEAIVKAAMKIAKNYLLPNPNTNGASNDESIDPTSNSEHGRQGPCSQEKTS